LRVERERLVALGEQCRRLSINLATCMVSWGHNRWQFGNHMHYLFVACRPLVFPRQRIIIRALMLISISYTLLLLILRDLTGWAIIVTVELGQSSHVKW